jgi:hypothetical protein
VHGGVEEVVLDGVWLPDLLSGRVVNVVYTGDGRRWSFEILLLVRNLGMAIN